MYQIKEVILPEERDLQISFLNSLNLHYEVDITYSILVYDGELLIGTASLADNIMKCFGVSLSHTGQNITGLMFKHLVDKLREKKIYHYFVFTSPENEEIFKSFHMHRIILTMNTVLLEGGSHILDELQKLKKYYFLDDEKKSCIIMNANPMTNGHLYLIEEARKQSKHLIVFVVSEDVSTFSFKARFNIIKEATKDMEDVTVVPSLQYLVSRMSFPKYFLKEDTLIKDEQTLIDVLIYKEYYKKIFNIERRFLGEEPFSPNTAKYNKVLKDHLGKGVEIVPRKELNNTPISASFIRKLIKENRINELSDYVPKATINYLQSNDGQEVITYIQEHDLTRH